MDKKEEAIKLFDSGFNCSQAVLTVFREELDLDENLALKIATGFGGGMRKGEVCGAVTGAIMALGMKYGHNVCSDTETKSRAYAITKEFIRRFEEKNETIICKNLLGYDLSNQEEYNILVEKGSFKTMCPEFIKNAIDILEEMMV